MDSLLHSIDPQIVLVTSAIVVALLLRLLLQVFQASFGSIATLLVIALVLYYVFDISPRQLWYEIGDLAQDLTRWARSII